MAYLPTNLGSFVGFHVGKYASPIEHLGDDRFLDGFLEFLKKIRSEVERLHVMSFFTIWMFPKNSGFFPPNHPLNNRVFHYKPSILGYPYFWKHPYFHISWDSRNKKTHPILEKICTANLIILRPISLNEVPQGNMHSLTCYLLNLTFLQELKNVHGNYQVASLV